MFSDKCLSFRLELVDEFPKIVPSACGPVIFLLWHQLSETFKTLLKNKHTLHKQATPMMMAYERSESTRDNLVKFIYQFQPETK